MSELRGTLRAVRFRDRELLALNIARSVTEETLSAFIRRAALGEARRLIEAETWETPQQLCDNARIDALQAERSGDDQ